MKEIPLTRGFVALVDDEDFDLVSAHKWCVDQSRGGLMYAIRGGPLVNGRRTSIRMHRLIMGAKRGQSVDHVSGDGLDNRRANLRFATVRENGQNSRTRVTNRSGFRGVQTRSHCPRKPFAARIVVDGNAQWLGGFRTAEAAARAYDAAAREHFGEFARLNFQDAL